MRTLARLTSITLIAVAVLAAIYALARMAGVRTDGIVHLPFLVKDAVGPFDPAATAAATAAADDTPSAAPSPSAPAGAATPTGGAAGEGRYAGRWTYLSNTDAVGDIAVDEAAGRVWAVGWGGVTAWDVEEGTSRTYTLADGLPSLRVAAVAVAADGTPWVGTRGDGAAWFGADGRWHALSFGDGPWDDDVLSVMADPDGSVWFGTGAGASRWWPDGRVTHYRSANGEVAGTVTAMAIDGAGNRWFGTYYSGLSVLRADGRWETFRADQGEALSFDLVIDVAAAPDGAVWVLSAGPSNDSNGPSFPSALDIVRADGTWSSVDLGGRGGDDDILRSVAFDGAGKAWLTSDGGLLMPDGAGGWRPLAPVDGLPTGGMGALAFDTAGRLWAATGAGLAARQPDGAWRTYRGTGGLPASTVNAIAIEADGTVWLGTGGGGLVRRTPDGTMRAFTTDDGLFGNSVGRAVADPTGGVWFSTGGTTESEDDGGVHHLTRDGRLTRFARVDGLPSSVVRAIAVDDGGNAWFGTSTYFYAPSQRRDGGLARRGADGTWRSFGRVLRGGDLNTIALAPDGGVWVGSDVISGAPTESLSYRAPDGGWVPVPLPVTDPPADDVYDLTLDGAGNLWVGTWGGVFRRAPDGSWTTPQDDPALSFQGSVITMDAVGALWFSAAPGTVRILHPDGTWETITEADGLAPASIEVIAVGPDGSMWFAGREGGVSILRPAGLVSGPVRGPRRHRGRGPAGSP
ncbi:MAG: two-component regulator propeller domain-containing protein [Ardenticatenales bacterium]